MKITKIPGLGDYGVYVDDVDFEHITNEEWMSLGAMHLQTLVTIFRNTNLSLDKFEQLMLMFGRSNNLAFYPIVKRYGLDLNYSTWNDILSGKIPVSDKDLAYVREASNINVQRNVHRVTGRRDDKGNALGVFSEGELLWHSNESGQLAFTPGVGLLSVDRVVGTSTGFMVTPNWYMDQTEAFRSELDEMIIIHDFTPGKMNPGLNESQDTMLSRNFSPEPTEIPLVIFSPGGIKGLHFSPNTVSYVKGMSKPASQDLFKKIESSLIKEPHIFDHWYQQQSGDLVLFDNSITQHRRLGGVTERLLYRTTMNYSNLLPHQWQPYYHPEYADRFKVLLKQIQTFMKIQGKPFAESA